MFEEQTYEVILERLIHKAITRIYVPESIVAGKYCHGFRSLVFLSVLLIMRTVKQLKLWNQRSPS